MFFFSWASDLRWCYRDDLISTETSQFNEISWLKIRLHYIGPTTLCIHLRNFNCLELRSVIEFCVTIKIKAIKQYFLIALVVMPHKVDEFFDVVVEVTRTPENKTWRNVMHRMESRAIVCYSLAVLKSYVINGENKNCVHVFTNIVIFLLKYVILLSLSLCMKLRELI